MDDVLLLSSSHWKAQKSITNGPHFELFPHGQPKSSVKTSQAAPALSIQAGKLKSTVNTDPRAFSIGFEANGEVLTELGWRSVGYVKENTTALHPKANYTDPNKGKRWVTYQLKLAVGAKVFGLGERFGPFQKNGQVGYMKFHIENPTNTNRLLRCGTTMVEPAQSSLIRTFHSFLHLLDMGFSSTAPRSFLSRSKQSVSHSCKITIRPADSSRDNKNQHRHPRRKA